MKVPEPKKQPSGMYFIQLRLGGKSYSFTCPTARQCRDAARTFKADYLAGRNVAKAEETDQDTPPSAPTLGAVIDSYLETHRAVLSPSTVRGYISMRKNRFQSSMDTPVDTIRWQQAVNEEVKQGMSPKTVKNTWALVARALKAEEDMDPKVMLPQVPVTHKPYLRPDEVLPFCEAVKGDVVEIAALLELHGLRRSEAKGLDWKDVDLKREEFHIRGALVMGEDGPVKKSTNKNKTSTRTVHMVIPRLVEVLRAVEKKEGPVVTISFQTMIRRIKMICEQAGLTVVGNHGLRYSCASLAYHLGIPERQLMEMCGWADYTTMHKIYIRISSQDVDTAFSNMKNFFITGGQSSPT